MNAIYLAGSLFNAAERLHNLFLEKHLKSFGYRVVLPQREALSFLQDGLFDIAGVVEDCRKRCTDRNYILVGNLDGPDADSGTAVEFGMAITSTGRAIVYRTDFRTALEKEVGVNAMFRAEGAMLVYQPCYFTDLDEVDDFYRELATKINEAILTLGA